MPVVMTNTGWKNILVSEWAIECPKCNHVRHLHRSDHNGVKCMECDCSVHPLDELWFRITDVPQLSKVKLKRKCIW